ncbi:MAG: HAMP domain-containing sensor histidine kinase [Labilithrix sp.]
MQSPLHEKAPRRPRTTSTGARLIVTFGAIVTLFGFALIVVLQAMARMEAAEQEDARLDGAKHASHHVSALLREQYIHQAHTIIDGDRTHLGHYEDVARMTAKAARSLVTVATRPDDRALAVEIEALVQRNHEDFLRTTLPAIDRGDHAEVHALHGEMEKVVVSAARSAAALSRSFERQSDDARRLATRERSRVRWTAISCFGAALLLAALVASATTKFIGRRVHALRDGARRFGEGQLERRIEVLGRDELSEVAAAMNEMAERLTAHQAELLRAQKLVSIGRLCAGVAHEINGPIGIILGYTSVIRKQGLDDESLSAIEDEARQCQRIVQGLLDTSRAETGATGIVDLSQLAGDAVERLRAAGKLGGRSIELRADEAVMAVGDESRLRQVILNLLSNAAEATGIDGRIVVEVARRDGRALVAVVDDGPGMAPGAKEHLFEPFYTTKDHGTGLGLAISRAIVEAHRGELTLEAARDGGTRAEVQLEVRPSEEAIA